MRRNIVHEGASNLKYEIREIVLLAREIRGLGQQITWENIGILLGVEGSAAPRRDAR